MKPIAIVGAGISGAVVARAMADMGQRCTVFEKHASVGGMCREIRWKSELVPEFGPHIFRTTSQFVWDFMLRFCQLVPLDHKVVTAVEGELWLFPPLQANEIKGRESQISNSYASVGDYLIATVGTEMFERYYESYTVKRWGVSAFELTSDMAPLIPTHRRTKSFFSELLVGVPAKGFLKCIENMLDDKLIQLRLNTPWREEFRKEYSRIIWTGRIDEVIPEMKCSVSFRSVCQEFAPLREWPSTDAGVINYPGKEVEYIRRSNYDMLLPWRPQVIGTEYACDVGYPAYPLRTHRAIVAVNEIKLQISEQIPDLTLHGRLGLFNYISMSQAIDNSLALVRSLKLIAPSSF